MSPKPSRTFAFLCGIIWILVGVFGVDHFISDPVGGLPGHVTEVSLQHDGCLDCHHSASHSDPEDHPLFGDEAISVLKASKSLQAPCGFFAWRSFITSAPLSCLGRVSRYAFISPRPPALSSGTMCLRI